MEQKNGWLMVGVAFSLMASAWAVAGEGGGGYNGPVTAGQAIPAALDKAITLDRLTTVMQGCYVDVLKSLARQMVKMTPEQFESTYHSNDWATVKWTFESVNTPQFRAYAQYFDGCMQIYGSSNNPLVTICSNFENPFGYQVTSNWSGLISFETQVRDVKFRMGGTVPLPIVEFDNTVKDAQTDELGNVLHSTVVIRGLRFAIPSQYQDQVYLKNGSTGLPSALKVNARAYLDCLFAGVQH